jgi:hydrogenase/urease accessory protein HupE
MQMIFRKAIAAAMVAGTFSPAVMSAHPGHAPTDLSAQVSAPLAGPDHFIAFVLLSGVLVAVSLGIRKARARMARNRS